MSQNTIHSLAFDYGINYSLRGAIWRTLPIVNQNGENRLYDPARRNCMNAARMTDALLPYRERIFGEAIFFDIPVKMRLVEGGQFASRRLFSMIFADDCMFFLSSAEDLEESETITTRYTYRSLYQCLEKFIAFPGKGHEIHMTELKLLICIMYRLGGENSGHTMTMQEKLEELCRAALKKHYGDNADEAARQLEWELQAIEKNHGAEMVFEAYAKVQESKETYFVKGTWNASLVMFLLGIAPVDPFTEPRMLYPEFCFGFVGNVLPDIELIRKEDISAEDDAGKEQAIYPETIYRKLLDYGISASMAFAFAKQAQVGKPLSLEYEKELILHDVPQEIIDCCERGKPLVTYAERIPFLTVQQ